MPLDLQLDVLLYPDEKGWLAHCLQLDLAEWGETLEAAQGNLLDVVRAHVESAVADDDLEHFFHPAPPEVWKRFFRAELVAEKRLPLDLPVEVFPPIRVREASDSRAVA
jgi:predicted RNase H-like HicB family nuclease